APGEQAPTAGLVSAGDAGAPADSPSRPARVVLLDTGRGVRAATVQRWREELGMLPRDELRLLSWQLPAEPLPLRSHDVLGPAGTDGAWAHVERLRRSAWRRTRRAAIAATARAAQAGIAPARLRQVGGNADKVANEGLSARFAAAVLRSRDAAQVVRAADVVAPVDLRSQRAAWALARRYPEADTVSTVAAASRIIARLHQQDTPSPTATQD
ncbi:MAG: hypothetical protein Q4P32_02975, partial [Micrococcales bacterium]|nr:hypothetical protein [Micrococcales bacterium]